MTRSPLDALPEHLDRELRQRLRKQTYDEVVAWLQSVGVETSRSSVCRHNRRLKARIDKLNAVREQMRGMIDAVRENPSVELTQTLLDLVASAAMDEVLRDDFSFDGADPVQLARTIGYLHQREVTRESLRLKYRQWADKVADRVRKGVKQYAPNVPDEALDTICQDIYGVVPG